MYPKRIRGRNILVGGSFERGLRSKENRDAWVDSGHLTNEEDGFLQGYFEEEFLE